MKMHKLRWIALALAGAALSAGLRAAETQPPQVVARAAPLYPYELAKKRVSGSVVVEFVIGTDGLVKQAWAVSSTDRGFEAAAIQAISRWRFKPGLKNGKPVNVRASQMLEFNVPVHRLIYPFELLQAGTEGRAVVGFWLDENKQLKKSIVLEASAPAFGEAARAALADDLKTSPGQISEVRDGMYQTTYDFNRKNSGDVAPVSDSAREILKQLKKKKPEISTLKELDAPPVAVLQLSPEFPVALRETHPLGGAVVEFFIDRQGNAQLPRIVSSTHEEFGYAAAQAVGQWQFEPPLRQGKPVLVRVRIPVEFDLGTPTGQ